MNSTRRLIVFEAKPCWQPELQRRFLNKGVDVGACRSIRDLNKRLSSEAVNAVVLDLAADLTGSLRWLLQRGGSCRQVPVIVVASAEQASLEWHLRELGATVFVDTSIGGARMAAVCRKLWQRENHSLPGPHTPQSN
ncbi:MAG: hypothetical protein AB7U20_03790 [Planctomycetaceae bacterium]